MTSSMPYRRALRRLPWVAALALGCRGTEIAPSRSHDAGPRTFATSLGDTAWVVELESDSAVSSPSALVYDGRQLYLADDVARTVRAIDAGSGRTTWTAAVRTESGDTITPVAMTPSRRGGVIVGDWTAGALWYLESDGGRSMRIVLSTGQTATRFCELPDTTLLVTPTVGRHTLYVFNRLGTVRKTLPVPWPALRSAPDDLLAQFVFAPSVDGCVVGLSYGVGFTSLTEDDFTSPRAYVEPVALPAVDSTITPTPNGRTIVTHLRSTEVAALDLATTPTRIVVAFGGHTADRNHLIDVYDSSGAYVESYRTRTAIGGIAANDSALFLLTRRRGVPVVVALRWPR